MPEDQRPAVVQIGVMVLVLAALIWSCCQAYNLVSHKSAVGFGLTGMGI